MHQAITTTAFWATWESGGNERRKRTRSGGGSREERGGERCGLVGRHARDPVGPPAFIGLASVLSLSPPAREASLHQASAR